MSFIVPYEGNRNSGDRYLTILIMSSTVASNFCMLLLPLWIASVLTSSVNNGFKTDGAVTSISNANVTITPLLNTTGNGTVLSPDAIAQESDNVKQTTSAPHGSLFMGEGGPISISSASPHSSNNDSLLHRESNALTTKENILQETGGHSSATNSPTSKIVPRKGADLNDAISMDKAQLPNNTKPIADVPSPIESSHINQHQTVETSTNHGNTSVQHSNNTLNATSNAASLNVTTSQENLVESSTPKTSTTVRMHKPKPTATIAGNDVDRPIPVSAKTSPFGMPRKIDYIVPVIITIIALPLMGAATYIVYRRGRDCWDKRHYRRMDFLIDGMYNYD